MSLPYDAGPPLTCARIRAVDRYAIEELGLPGIVLMENAGRAVAERVWAELRGRTDLPIVVLCGPGNNGGDGFVIARHLRNSGASVSLVLAVSPDKYRGDAAINLEVCRRLGYALTDASTPEGMEQARHLVANAYSVVDALLGTGSRGAPRAALAELIRHANASSATRIAVDIPSGLDADTGVPAETCLRADKTVALFAAKVGFTNPAARAVLGRVVVAGIGLSYAVNTTVNEFYENLVDG